VTEDYSEFLEDAPTDNLLTQITATAEHMKEVADELAALEEKTKAKKTELETLQTQIIPELMDAAGLAEFRTRSGTKIVIKEVVKASITKERNGAAMAWLRENGYGALIKNQVIAEFGKGEDDRATKVLHSLKANGVKHVKQTEGIHYQTLNSWVKETMENSPEVDIPVELFGIFQRKVATIE